MHGFPRPFFRTARNAWFAQVVGKQLKVGPDREAAERRYHELMGRTKADPRPVDADAGIVVLDAFLDWCSKHTAGRTYDWYRDYLESFARPPPSHPEGWVRMEEPAKSDRIAVAVARVGDSNRIALRFTDPCPPPGRSTPPSLGRAKTFGPRMETPGPPNRRTTGRPRR